jgi:3-phosphoglycerate kinase
MKYKLNPTELEVIDDSITNQIILLRADLNIPIRDGKIQELYKIKQSLPTIKLLAHKNTLIIITHLGDPNGKINHSLSTRPIALNLAKLLKQKVTFIPTHDPQTITKEIEKGKSKIFLLENLRFDKREENNDASFAQELASTATLYVNDAFAACHRPHASIVRLPQMLPHRAGLLLTQEIANLNFALNPKKPSIWIMGGAKLSKVELLEQALQKADLVLIGGALACVFCKAQGFNMGRSKIDSDSITIAKKILQNKISKKIILPVDFNTAVTITKNAPSKIKLTTQIQDDDIALDIGPKTITLFQEKLENAKTIVWNGPLGYFELPAFGLGTKKIATFLGKLGAITIIGGGETAQAIRLYHQEKKVTHLSTGGGASLEYLSGKTLPGLTALEKKY